MLLTVLNSISFFSLKKLANNSIIATIALQMLKNIDPLNNYLRKVLKYKYI